MKQKGFTLAEVLITLTIIGVIAALTIPNLMRKYESYLILTKFKKAYNSVYKMAENIKVTSGCNDLNCTGLPAYESPIRGQDKQMYKFIELAQIKSPKIITSPALPTRDINGKSKISFDYQNHYKFITQDGFVYHISGIGAYNKNAGAIRVDVGFGIPKEGYYRHGINSFPFAIDNNFRVHPVVQMGYNILNYGVNPNDLYKGRFYCNPDNGYSGSCAARIILAGWKVDYIGLNKNSARDQYGLRYNR